MNAIKGGEQLENKIIQLNGIKFQYFESDAHALNNVSLSINKGEWIALIGPNGSGKSTLAKMINGLLVPSSGTVSVKGLSLSDETVWDIRKAVGMVFQNPDNQFVGATVEDDVAFGLENHGVPREEMKERILEALEQVRMLEFLKSEPARLSGGQKQRVAIASVIALRPDIIILDEATAMLDPQGRFEVIEAVRKIKEKYQLTVISITHDLDEAAYADRVVVLNQGQVVRQDAPNKIFQSGDSLMEMGLGVPFGQKLKELLIKGGLDLPNHYLSEEELLKWITQSYLTK